MCHVNREWWCGNGSWFCRGGKWVMVLLEWSIGKWVKNDCTCGAHRFRDLGFVFISSARVCQENRERWAGEWVMFLVQRGMGLTQSWGALGGRSCIIAHVVR